MPMSLRSLLLASILSASTALSAQQTSAPAPPPPPAGAPQHMRDPAREAKGLGKRLGLTADQTGQVQTILADAQQRTQALMSDSNLDPKSMHKQRRAVMVEADSKINAVLTADQRGQYATLKAERHHGKGAPGNVAPPAPAPAPTF